MSYIREIFKNLTPIDFEALAKSGFNKNFLYTSKTNVHDNTSI